MAELLSVQISAASNAADLGLRALADLAHATDGHQYRVIGGHMVHLLTLVYPTPDAVARVTADADAGIDTVVAAGDRLHGSLLARGYTLITGNHYEAPSGDDSGPLSIDLLVPSMSAKPIETVILGGRGFDAIPGLGLALAADPLEVSVHAFLYSGSELSFTIPIPDVEVAVVLKALAWQSRTAAKDIADLCSLMEIAHHHSGTLRSGWSLDGAAKGARVDAQRALHVLLKMIDRQQQSQV